MWFRRKAKVSPADAARDLRDRALNVQPAELGLVPTKDRPHVWGVLMETGYPEAVATLVALGDGTVSLYFSSGGGIIGAGEHAAVRATVATFLSAAEAHLSSLSPAEETPLPDVGRVRFYVRSFEGTLGAEASESDLGSHRHSLSPLFHAGHLVIASTRQVSEKPSGGGAAK